MQGKELKIITLAAVGLFLSLTPLHAEFRVFTNSNGSTIEAEILSHKDGKVTLRRVDNKEFEVNPEIFSADDQKYISAWMAKTPVLVAYKFRIDGEIKKTKHKNSSYFDAYYVISVTNQSQDSQSNLQFDYRLLYKTSDTGSIEVEEGSEILDANLDFNRTFVITSKSVSISNYYKGKVLGCLMRVSDNSGKVVLDWVSPNLSMKGKAWYNTNPNDGSFNSGSTTIK
jgi:hypothetical protein